VKCPTIFSTAEVVAHRVGKRVMKGSLKRTLLEVMINMTSFFQQKKKKNT